MEAGQGVLCDIREPIMLKGEFYRTIMRPVLLYRTEYRAIKKRQEHKMEVREMRMFRYMSGVSRRTGLGTVTSGEPCGGGY